MSQDPKLQPRYSGIPTFMRTPFVPDLEGLDIALVGVPFDGGVTNRTGARHGPRGGAQPVQPDAHHQPGHRDRPL